MDLGEEVSVCGFESSAEGLSIGDARRANGP